MTTVPEPSASDFREPFRSQFIDAIQQGAASTDIHDVSAAVGFAGSSTQASAPFLKRELERPHSHSANICRWIRQLTPVTRILDVGCGTAGLSVALAWTFPDAVVDCFDADELSVRAGTFRISGYGLEARIRPRALAPNAAFPYESESFDLVSCASVLEFITRVEDRRAFLREIRRVVRPGGHIILTTPNPWYLFELHSRRFLGNWYRRPGIPWASTGGWIRRQLSDCAFHSVTARVASKFHRELPPVVCRMIEPLMPWQFLLAEAPRILK
jgi:SAM-dependent methyltransferase